MARLAQSTTRRNRTTAPGHAPLSPTRTSADARRRANTKPARPTSAARRSDKAVSDLRQATMEAAAATYGSSVAMAAPLVGGGASTSGKGSSAADDHLSFYFRDLAVFDLLGPDQERDLAMGIEGHEIGSWRIVLAQAAVTARAISLVEHNLERPVAFAAVLKAAAAVQAAAASRRPALQRKLDEAAAEAAIAMRAADLDREHMDAVVRDLDKARTNNEALAGLSTAAFTTWHDALRRSHHAGAALRDQFVRANLRLVVTMARRYDRGGMPLPDLIQEGNLGLIHAVSRFDHRRGLRFSTYACWWIRHAIGRALADKARAVRIPVHMLEAQQQLEKVRQQQLRELGRPPTPQELAKAARVPLAKLNQMHRYLMGSSVSLDRPLHDDDDRAMGDLLADPASEDASPADEMTTSSLATQVSKMLHLLTPIEADVVRKRFGLKDDEERTFREIGDEYELSRERIRQIQNSALGKLRRAMEREHRGHVDA